jgi:hypothetical protein
MLSEAESCQPSQLERHRRIYSPYAAIGRLWIRVMGRSPEADIPCTYVKPVAS